MDFVGGVDYRGHRFTEVGATKFGKKLKTGLKKVGKGLGKVTNSIVHAAAKIVPSPYNVAFTAAAKVGDKAASAVQKAKAKKAVRGLAQLAKGGDRKAAATLVMLKHTKDAAAGKPQKALQTIAQAHAKQAQKAKDQHVKTAVAKVLAHPAVANLPREQKVEAAQRAADNASAFQVITPSGKKFAIRL